MKSAAEIDDQGKLVRRPVARRGGCGCPKIAYTRRKVALEQAGAQRRASGEWIEAYHCEWGHCWHIGHPPGSRS